MTIKANTLFHFTPREDFLFDILENGFWPRYCREDIGWAKNKNFEFCAYPMVCFCDIPLSKISEHTEFYGEFGIGMTKEWAIKHELSPIWYVLDKTDLLKKFKIILKYIKSLEKKDGFSEIVENIKDPIYDIFYDLLKYIKPVSGKMEVKGKKIEKKFDEESEWRYVPNNENIRKLILDYSSVEIDEENKKTKTFASEIDEENKKTKTFASLMFEPKDIKYIFVPKDSDIPEIAKKIQAVYLKKYDYNEVYLLISKIISLETIYKDL